MDAPDRSLTVSLPRCPKCGQEGVRTCREPSSRLIDDAQSWIVAYFVCPSCHNCWEQAVPTAQPRITE